MSRTDSPSRFITPPGEGRHERVLGVTQHYKAESHQTGGALCCIEIVVPPGQGIPPHTHRSEDEAFYVLEGEVAISGDGDEMALGTGGFFYGPRNLVHGFRNAGDVPAKLLVFITPGSNIEKMFGRLSELTERDGANMNPAEIAAICAEHSIEFEKA